MFSNKRESQKHKLKLSYILILLTGFIKLACRFGHSKEKMDLHASLHHQEYWQYQKYLLKLSGDYQLSQCWIFKNRAFWRHRRYWKSKSSSNFSKNKSLELVLEHNAKALSTLLLDSLILLCSFIYRESSELVDRRYDSLNTLTKLRYKCFKCLFLALTL